MILLIAAFPMAALEVKVIKNLESLDMPLYREEIWYTDIFLCCQKIIDNYQINEINFVGSPLNYVEGLVNQFKEKYNIPVFYIS